MPKRFGSIPGVPEGSLFATRAELSRAGVHPPTQAGISGNPSEGADCIVLSGGYEDDLDQGDVIVYTGQGGRDPATGKQIADQELTRGNAGLVRSMERGHPVRVVRGPDPNSPHAPAHGYRYDGLYEVTEAWREPGRSGHLVIRFTLRKLPSRGAATPRRLERQGELPLATRDPAKRVLTIVSRVVRDTAMGKAVKSLYNFECQVCGEVIETPKGRYAEAAHIRPLGVPHNGPDSIDNVLCLCPNHHVLFDAGAFSIDNKFRLLGVKGRLTVHEEHNLDEEFLSFHRNQHGL